MPDPPATPLLSIEVERRPDRAALVLCHGRLVEGSTEILISGVRPLFLDYRRVVLDLSDLMHINSEGLGALTRLHVAAKAAGSSLELVNLSQYVRQVLIVTHLLGAFTVLG